MSSNVISNTSYPSSLDVESNRPIYKEANQSEQNIPSIESAVDIAEKKFLVDNVFSNKIDENLQATSKLQSLANEIPTEKELDLAIEVVANFINQPPRNVNFTKDASSGKTVIKVFELKSKELIKQFPSEELISIAQKIKALQQEVGEKAGILFDEKV